MNRPRVAVVRGPNLNRWEMQNFQPISDRYEFVGIASTFHNFPLDEIPFETKELFSVGQALRLRMLRRGFDRVFGDYHDLRGLERELKGFDIVNSVETVYRCSYQAALAKRRCGFKLVVTVWENIPFAVHHPAAQRLKAVVNNAADLFLAVSERTKEVLILEGAPEERIRILPPGIDTAHFAPRAKNTSLLRRFGCDEEDCVVLFVANLYWEKGIFDVLVSFRRAWDLLGKPRKLKLLIAGKGREEAEIQRWIRLLGIDALVRLIGSYPYSQMPAIHSLADVFVLPSIPTRRWQEQFGYVLAESMACGKAVITSRSGSIPEVVGEAAVLVEPADFLGLRDAIVLLVGDSRLRTEMSRKARSRAETLFDINSTSLKMADIYDELL